MFRVPPDHVGLQVRLHRALVLAEGARVGLLASVGPDVLPEVVLMVEHLVTERTFESVGLVTRCLEEAVEALRSYTLRC